MFHSEFYPTPKEVLYMMQLDCKDKVKHEKSFEIKPNEWYEFGFFNVKFFKKGTMHVKFKNMDDWYRLNHAYGQLKGFSLPETYKK